jgi:hypothetical protein
MINRFNGVFTDHINLVDDIRAGFAFKASIHRVNAYQIVEGGFVNFTRNVSYGKDGHLA